MYKCEHCGAGKETELGLCKRCFLFPSVETFRLAIKRRKLSVVETNKPHTSK